MTRKRKVCPTCRREFARKSDRLGESFKEIEGESEDDRTFRLNVHYDRYCTTDLDVWTTDETCTLIGYYRLRDVIKTAIRDIKGGLPAEAAKMLAKAIEEKT